MSHAERRSAGDSFIAAKDAIALLFFVIGFSLPLLANQLEVHMSGALMGGLGLLLCTVGVALLSLRKGGHEQS